MLLKRKEFYFFFDYNKVSRFNLEGRFCTLIKRKKVLSLDYQE